MYSDQMYSGWISTVQYVRDDGVHGSLMEVAKEIKRYETVLHNCTSPMQVIHCDEFLSVLYWAVSRVSEGYYNLEAMPKIERQITSCLTHIQAYLSTSEQVTRDDAAINLSEAYLLLHGGEIRRYEPREHARTSRKVVTIGVRR